MVNSAFVRVVGESEHWTEKTLDEVKSLCRAKDLLIVKNDIVFEADEFDTSHYDYPPHITLYHRSMVESCLVNIYRHEVFRN